MKLSTREQYKMERNYNTTVAKLHCEMYTKFTYAAQWL